MAGRRWVKSGAEEECSRKAVSISVRDLVKQGSDMVEDPKERKSWNQEQSPQALSGKRTKTMSMIDHQQGGSQEIETMW